MSRDVLYAMVPALEKHKNRGRTLCPCRTMRLTDDEDGSSSGGSSSSDSYVEAPLENAAVGGGDPP